MKALRTSAAVSAEMREISTSVGLCMQLSHLLHSERSIGKPSWHRLRVYCSSQPLAENLASCSAVANLTLMSDLADERALAKKAIDNIDGTIDAQLRRCSIQTALKSSGGFLSHIVAVCTRQKVVVGSSREVAVERATERERELGEEISLSFDITSTSSFTCLSPSKVRILALWRVVNVVSMVSFFCRWRTMFYSVSNVGRKQYATKCHASD